MKNKTALKAGMVEKGTLRTFGKDVAPVSA